MRKLVNSTIEVLKRRIVIDKANNTKNLLIDVEFYSQILGKRERKTYEWNKINSGKFMNDIPDFLIINPGCASKVQEIFRWVVQNMMQNLPVEQEIVHPFGWDDKKFYWPNEAIAALG